MTLAERFRDWWRGYTDGDVMSLQVKWNDGLSRGPGGLIHLTNAEHKALRAGEDVWAGNRPRWMVTVQASAEVRELHR